MSVGGLVCSWDRTWYQEAKYEPLECYLVFRKPNEDYCNWYVKEVPIGSGYQLQDDEIADIKTVIEAIDQETLRQEAVAAHRRDFAALEIGERRVGKECRIGCRSRWSPYH